MMMRSSRTEPPDLTNCVAKTTDDLIESMVCPPPPSDSALNEEAISSLIVPAPKWSKESVSPDGESTAPPSDRSVMILIMIVMIMMMMMMMTGLTGARVT